MNRYPGGAFSPDLPGGRGGGHLFCTEDTLFFEREGSTLSLPLSGLRLERGGAGARLFYFKHANFPQTILHTGAEALLSEPALAAMEEVRKTQKTVKSTKRFNLAGVGILTAILLAIPFTFWLGQDALISLAARQIPPVWEEKIGEIVFQQIKAQTRLVEDPETLRQFEALAAPLASQSSYKIRLHIADTSEINAFALPGGHVVFNRGLIEKASSPEEVLGVLAHEIAHVEKRHTLRQILRSLGIYFTFQILIGDFSGALGLIQDSSLFLMQQGYSRGMENEADAAGHASLIHAGLPTGGMLKFFETLKSEESLQIPALLSTHPATEERIHNIESLQASAPTFPPVTFDFAALQQRLRETQKSVAPAPAPAPAPELPAATPGKALPEEETQPAEPESIAPADN